MGSDKTGDKRVKSVEVSFTILKTIQDLEGATLSEISDELDLHKSTVYVHLNTLTHNRLVVKDDNQYNVGLRFLGFGASARANRTIYPKIKPKMRRLAKETGERVQFMVEEHGRGIYVHRVRGEYGVQTANHIGNCRYLHTSAAGKAILSKTADEEIDEIIDRWGLPSQTPHTVVDRSQLMEEIASIRENGYALNREEHIEGLWAIGAPVTNQDGTVLGGLSISGPAHRIRDENNRTELIDQLLGIVNETELDLRK